MVRTPHLDALAKRGIRFTRAYSQSMICAPARLSMMTGQYVHSHGYYGNWGTIPDQPIWITGYLRKHGYQTALVGKGHYGYDKIRREFDFFRICDRADSPPDDPLRNDYYRMLVEKGRQDDHDVLISQRRGNNEPFRSRLPKELTLEWWTGDMAIEFLRHRDPSKPFFAHISFQRPHAPITPPAPYDSMYKPEEIRLPPSVDDDFRNKPAEQRAAANRSAYPYHPTDKRKLQEIMAMYFGLITSVDDNVGRIIAELDKQGLTANTLVIFTADHGDFSGEHGFFHKNLGMYEAIHRIPYLAAGPGIPAGQVRNELVEQVDIFPTACDLAGLPLPDSVQGLSLRQFDKWPRTAAFGEAETRKCIRTERYRLVWDPQGSANELYDHVEDPWEMVNQYQNAAFKDVRLALMDEFMRFYARTEQQTISTSWLPRRRVDMPPGPTRDLWWNNMDWDVVKAKYKL